MQATKLCDQFRTRAQQQVIGVGKHDARPNGLQVIGSNSLDRGMGTDWHEHWRSDRAMRRMDDTSPRHCRVAATYSLEGQRAARERCRPCLMLYLLCRWQPRRVPLLRILFLCRLAHTAPPLVDSALWIIQVR